MRISAFILLFALFSTCALAGQWCISQEFANIVGPISYNIKRDTNGKVILKLNYTKQPPNGFAVPAGTELKL
ncbi:MAG: hypothetical protein NTW93_00620 [Phycisphaerae bacterium]|nr:hypothetical protein [Phycisphaerae bacterium]